MGALILKKDIVDKIKKNPDLFGKVFDCLDTTVSYGLQLLQNNDPKLTQATVLRIIRENLGVKDDSDLLEELETESTSEETNRTTNLIHDSQ